MPGKRRWLWIALGFALGVGATLLVAWAYTGEGFLKDTWDTATRDPLTPTKVLGLLAALIVVLTLPLAVADWRSDVRFRKLEARMRVERPGSAVTDYDGPEGRGLLFEGDEGRALLLRPVGGLGAPRVVELSSPPSAPQGMEEQAPDA